MSYSTSNLLYTCLVGFAKDGPHVSKLLSVVGNVMSSACNMTIPQILVFLSEGHKCYIVPSHVVCPNACQVATSAY